MWAAGTWVLEPAPAASQAQEAQEAGLAGGGEPDSGILIQEGRVPSVAV